MTPPLPDAWHEVEDPDYITEKYRSHNPTLFVRDAHDVGVHVRPVSTSSPHDSERFRVGAIRGNEDEFEEELDIETFEDHERALERALEFANRYEEAYAELGDEEVSLGSAVARVS